MRIPSKNRCTSSLSRSRAAVIRSVPARGIVVSMVSAPDVGTKEIDLVPPCHLGDAIRKFLQFLEFQPVFRIPGEVLVAEMVDRVYDVSCLRCRPGNVPRGETRR